MYKAIKVPMTPVEERDDGIWAFLKDGDTT